MEPPSSEMIVTSVCDLSHVLYVSCIKRREEHISHPILGLIKIFYQSDGIKIQLLFINVKFSKQVVPFDPASHTF